MKVITGIACMVAVSSLLAPVHAQSFSCSIGQPACIQYGQKVVQSDAQCFDSFACLPGGFVCKKSLDELASNAKTFADRAGRIASGYDSLRLCLSKASDMDAVRECMRQDLLNVY